MVEMAIKKDTVSMRSFVEKDEKSGLVSLFALKSVQEKYK